MSARLLAGRRALITGASRGLGAAIARRFWEAGASLVLLARREPALRRFVASLPAREEQMALPVVADLAVPDLGTVAEEVAAAAGALGGPLDVLVNNAGVQGPIGPLEQIGNRWEAWVQTIQVNLLAPVRLIVELLPRMSDGGVIINVGGGGATAPRPNFSAYAVAKTALVRLTECLADELRPRRIRVLALAPGVLPTDMLREVSAAGEAAAGEREVAIARRALEQPDAAALDRAASCALWMASDAAVGITGRLISAVWDPWSRLGDVAAELAATDVYTLRRITPRDRGLDWGDPVDSAAEPPAR
ncbi:MAG: SDR family oxidoreductase [Kiritimatiellae bacterium]|nr:SDR family oxidoreductase [Kiritimatiellia bacterium]